MSPHSLCFLRDPIAVARHALLVQSGMLLPGAICFPTAVSFGTFGAPSLALCLTHCWSLPLTALHALSVLHRDIKPDSMPLGHDGT